MKFIEKYIVEIIIVLVILVILIPAVYAKFKKSDNYDGFGKRGGRGRRIKIIGNPFVYPTVDPIYEGEDPKDLEIKRLKEKLKKTNN